MEETAANQTCEEELSFREGLSEDLSTSDVLLIVVPLIFNFSITAVSGYFDKYVNQYVFLILATALLWLFIFFLKPELARIKFKIIFLAIAAYIVILFAFNWIKFTVFDSSQKNLLNLVSAASFLLVWIGFRFIQKLTKP